jgi:hypothetical protein
MSRKAGRIATLGAMLATIGAMWVAAAPAMAREPIGTIKSEFNNWVVSGYLTPKLLNEPVNLPPGSTFNGSATIQVYGLGELEGTATGTVFVPPFTAKLKVLGTVPTEVGVTFTQAGLPEGTIVSVPRSECSGPANVGPGSNICVNLKVPTKAILGMTVEGVLGIEPPPDKCETAEPVTFPLSANVTLLELITKGPKFVGEVTIPPITCEGVEGIALGVALTAAMSGPDNQFAIAIAPPPRTA